MAPPNTEDTELIYRSTTYEDRDEVKFEKDYVPPSFTIKEIRQVIPQRCFERSTFRSFGYLLRDLSVIGALAYAASFIDSTLPYALRLIAWPIYWFFAGAFATGVWVLAHECGHRAFSPNKTVNNLVGLVLHSALLVPYYSWRSTHSTHHKHTNLVSKDTVFVAKTRSQVGLPPKNSNSVLDRHDIFEDAPIVSLLKLISQQLLGWPAYLLLNKSNKAYGDRWVNHFDPSSPIFPKNQYTNVIISDIGIIATLSALVYLSYTFSFLTVVKFYLIPYLVVNHWLVMITFLQHTDPKLPHYRDSQWNFVRGAACTVDRNWGFLDSIFHKISSTHVAHHYFSEMPHYHAEEATKHLSKLLGPYYIFDDTPIFRALWRSFKECRFIEDEGDVVFYKRYPSDKDGPR